MGNPGNLGFVAAAGRRRASAKNQTARRLFLILILGQVLGSGWCLPGRARAAGLRSLADGWLLPSRYQRQVIGQFPKTAADAGASGWLLAGSCRLFGMEQLPVRELSAGVRSRLGNQDLHLSGRWETTGDQLFKESWWQGRLGWGQHLGLWFRRWSLILAGEPSGSARCWGGDAGGRLWEHGDTWIAARFWWDLSRPPQWFGLQGRKRLACFSFVHPGWGLGVDLDRRGSGQPGLTFDALLQVAPAVGLGLRSDPATGTHGPTLIYAFHSFLLRTSHLAHPDLGVTHRFSLVWGDPGPGEP